MNHHMFKFAASSLVLGLALVGCSTSTRGTRVADFAARAPGSAQSARFYQIAQIALKNGNVGAAIKAMESAIILSPRDAGYRMGLAELYMRTGRFVSAETTFADSLALNPGNSRAGFYLALTQIAQGKTYAALAQLDGMDSRVAPADIGLAYALAGNSRRALELLEPAARAPGANGRVRQNLALAYALAGEWQKAKITASQDISPGEIDNRMTQWAALADPSATGVRVASLLGTTAVHDPGQPSQLALVPVAPMAPAGPVTAFAEEPAPAAPVAAPAPVQLAFLPAEVAPVADVPASPAVPAVAETAPPPAAPVELAPEVQVQYAQAAQSLIEPEHAVETDASQSAEAAVRPAIVPVPVPAFVPARTIRPSSKFGTGRYVVQIGAFRSAAQVEKAWLQARRRFGFNGGQEPLSTTVRIPGKGTLHRLSVASFNSQPTAARMCRSIKAKGGACFVRATAGDAPMRWVSRDGRNRRA